MNLTHLAREHGDKPAVIMGGTGATMSYAELERRSNQVAHLFRARGLRAGDRIAILMVNELDLFPVVWAAQRAGLYYAPVNWHLSAEEAAYIVADCGARLLVSSAALEPLAAAAAAAAPGLSGRLVAGDGAADVVAGEAAAGGAAAGGAAAGGAAAGGAAAGGAAAGGAGAEWLAAAVEGLPGTPVADETEGWYMFYSSGTTGKPKGIVRPLIGQPFGAGLGTETVMRLVFGFSSSSVYLCPGPLYHAAPLAWSIGTIRNGGTVVVMERFDAATALSLIERYRVTEGQFVPTMFVRMLRLPQAERAKYDLSSLRLAVHAAAPVAVEVKREMIGWLGPVLAEYYAGSEANGICVIDSNDWLAHPGSVGRPLGVEVHIVGEDGTELPAGEVGTVYFSGGSPFEYHNDPGKTASAFNPAGWSTLGDMGYLDDEGYLYLADRRTDLIVSGGVNIYPREVEEALAPHPAVADVAVVGIPDEEMGQRVHAVVQPAVAGAGTPELAAELIDFCRARIAHFKAPASVSFEDSLPRTPSGKMLRRVVADKYRDGAPAGPSA